MGLKKYAKRVTKGAKKAFNKYHPMGKGEYDEGDARGEAAAQLIKQDVSRQAGSGQIKYTEEKYA